MARALVITIAFILIQNAKGSSLRSLSKMRYIGTALKAEALKEFEYKNITVTNFNSITPENEMKWSTIEKTRGRYKWKESDQLVAMAQQYSQKIRGHTLVWHRQIPHYLNNLTTDELNDTLKKYIDNILTRYKGKIYAWDVVNEVIEDDGKFRNSIWYKNFNETYISKAFYWTHSVDPNAKLYINDYNIESYNDKSNGLYSLVSELLKNGIPIHGVGFQSHFIAGKIPKDLVKNMKRFADLGLDVAITESDIRIQLPETEEKLEQQAKDYLTVFKACQSVSKCVGVTLWGFTDKYSWIPQNFKNYGSALPWDNDYDEKPAVSAIEEVLENKF